MLANSKVETACGILLHVWRVNVYAWAREWGTHPKKHESKVEREVDPISLKALVKWVPDRDPLHWGLAALPRFGMQGLTKVCMPTYFHKHLLCQNIRSANGRRPKGTLRSQVTIEGATVF